MRSHRAKWPSDGRNNWCQCPATKESRCPRWFSPTLPHISGELGLFSGERRLIRMIHWRERFPPTDGEDSAVYLQMSELGPAIGLLLFCWLDVNTNQEIRSGRTERKIPEVVVRRVRFVFRKLLANCAESSGLKRSACQTKQRPRRRLEIWKRIKPHIVPALTKLVDGLPDQSCAFGFILTTTETGDRSDRGRPPPVYFSSS